MGGEDQRESSLVTFQWFIVTVLSLSHLRVVGRGGFL